MCWSVLRQALLQAVELGNHQRFDQQQLVVQVDVGPHKAPSIAALQLEVHLWLREQCL